MTTKERDEWIETQKKKYAGKRVISKNFGFIGTTLRPSFSDPFSLGNPHVSGVWVLLDTPIQYHTPGYKDCPNPSQCCEHGPTKEWFANVDDIFPEKEKEALSELKSLLKRAADLETKLKESE